LNNFLITIGLCLLHCSANCQYTIEFKPILNGQKLFLDSADLYTVNSNEVVISNLKFYAGALHLVNHKKQKVKTDSSYHLIDLAKPESTKLQLEFQEELLVNDFRFKLGVDSITNVSGAYGGDLDPTLGMYWTWQSGYINFKLEGFYATENGNREFQYHLGGYLNPFETVQEIRLDILTSKKIVVLIDLEKFLKSIPAELPDNIMSPGKNAKLLSELLVPIFSLENE
tara:strand:+ start:7754 stop:8434 length:681 start_codon:yes stop_codon:yes gene_type:complete